MADILVVDDSTSTLKLIEILFKKNGHEVTSCKDYPEAVAALEMRQDPSIQLDKPKGPFAAIITDWQYPGSDGNPFSGGADFLNYLLANPQHRPQHLLVGSGNDVTEKMGGWSGMNPAPQAYVKPTSFNNAIKNLSAALKS